MWSLWKPSPSRQKADNESSGNSAPVPIRDSGNEHGSKSSHQLSLLAIRGNTSEPGMMSSLSYSRHSASVLNAESFVASTPAPTGIPHSHEHDMISVSSQSTSYTPMCPHDELQTSTQIEDIESEKVKDTQIHNCYRNVKEINSVSETPSRFQVTSAEKAVLLRDNSNKISFTNSSSIERHVFVIGSDTPKAGKHGKFSDSSGSAGKAKTPKGSRINPFESHLSMDTLHLPTFSPSVFSTVLSPSQETSARFWSIDQQSMLFPAKISDESPWKQETAISRLDADTENSTQEAIDIYFNQHHKITSPEELPRTNVQNERGSLSVQTNLSHVTMEDLGGSPELRGKSIIEEIGVNPSDPIKDQNISSCLTKGSPPKRQENLAAEKVKSDRPSIKLDLETEQVNKCTRWTQTTITLPPILPIEVEDMLRRYNLVNDDVNISASVQCTSSPLAQRPQLMPRSYSRIASIVANTSGGDESNNLSNSTLRRKLFEGLLDDEYEQPEDNEVVKSPCIPNVDCDSKSSLRKTEPQNKSDSEDELGSPKIFKQYRNNFTPHEKDNMNSTNKENVQPVHNVNITPGAIMLTPKANSVGPTPDRSLTWSLSPVSRHKKPRELVGPPIESSTPTK